MHISSVGTLIQITGNAMTLITTLCFFFAVTTASGELVNCTPMQEIEIGEPVNVIDVNAEEQTPQEGMISTFDGHIEIPDTVCPGLDEEESLKTSFDIKS